MTWTVERLQCCTFNFELLAIVDVHLPIRRRVLIYDWLWCQLEKVFDATNMVRMPVGQYDGVNDCLLGSQNALYPFYPLRLALAAVDQNPPGSLADQICICALEYLAFNR